MDEDVTPIRQQYLEIKRQYQEAILFFRLGDFYETFDQDAETTARELDIVLTSRNVAKGSRIPMAGVPYHAVEGYLARLIEKGYHVAICEQVGEQPLKGIFPRQVVRVVTPGTVIEPGLLHSDKNNYLASACVMEDRAGVAYVDITTGEFATTELRGEDILHLLRAELNRLNPAELILPEALIPPEGFPSHQTHLPNWRFESGRCQELLQTQFQTLSLEGFGLQGMPLAIAAAGAILQYLQDNQPNSLRLLNAITTYTTGDFMILDAVTRRNLELTETIRSGEAQGSLLSVLDHTLTPMGKRLIRQWVNKPLLDIPGISQRQTWVRHFLEKGMLRAELRDACHALGDLERLTNRILSGHATPRDLIALRHTLRALPGIRQVFLENEHPFEVILRQFHLCEETFVLLEQAISEDAPQTLQTIGIIKPGFSSELDQVIEASRAAREWISNLENVERERSGIKTLKVGYNKVFGYFIEVTNSHTSLVPEDYIRKQTLVNAERYITPEMKEYEALVINAEGRIHEIEVRLFHEICTRIGLSGKHLLQTSAAIAQIDVLASLAEAAAIGNYACPEVVEAPLLELHQCRHPVVERNLTSNRFVANDAMFEEGEVIRVITGPNMSGKSTYLRQIALIVLMAQMGSFVPASAARVGIVDRIFTRIGAQDEIHSGQSTFMVEMIETANILHHATNRSLIILDEIGRGTSTYDGVSIAWAVIEHLHNHPKLRARTLFATHYHELTQLSEILPGVRNYNVAVSEAEGKVIFLHRIVPGGADRSYGIHVAQLAGLPAAVIERANAILHQLELSSGKAVHINPTVSQQMVLFPETNPLVDELKKIDINTLSPVAALNKLYEWQREFGSKT